MDVARGVRRLDGARLPAGSRAGAKSAEPAAGVPSPATSKEATFLKKMHASSCTVFATVLGPEANDAHRDHFHLDMKVRQSSHGVCH